MIKNATFDFASAPLKHQRSFRGIPNRKLVPSARKLYRFVTAGYNAIASTRFMDSSEAEGSPFWIPDDVFRQLTKTQLSTGAALKDVGRSRLAVTKEFNPTMGSICVVELKVTVFGWRGPTRQQFDSDVGVWLPGGLEQYYIPNLGADDLRFVYCGSYE